MIVIKVTYLLILSFLIGGIPTGYLITKVVHKKDLRNIGSGNIGFANVVRTAGLFSGIVVLVVDSGKAFCAAYYLSRLFDEVFLYRLLFGITLILGNIFTPFLKFKGGKGVAAGLGVALAFSPYSVLFSLGAFLFTILITQFISLGSLIAAAIFAASNILFYVYAGKDVYSVLFSALLFLAIVIRHTSNIKRLIRGEENKFGNKKQ